MIYVVGAGGLVASATELVIAFVMGFFGTIKWAMAGMVDIRLTLIILAGSLLGCSWGHRHHLRERTHDQDRHGQHHAHRGGGRGLAVPNISLN